ncbi:MAG: Gx transporter family protein [Mariprofundales bacterium]|nr:Gx transporter family protein [Mariprofundales bacterium]
MPLVNSPATLQQLRERYQWLALLALAAALQLFESLLPSLGPWFKPGLANIVTLITLVFLGPRAALSLAVARVVVGGLFLGTLFTPTIVVSGCAATVAAAIMVLLWRLPCGLSLIGISLAAAAAHMVTQCVVVELLIIQQPAIFYLLPPLLLLATITGWINGTIATAIVGRVELRP